MYAVIKTGGKQYRVQKNDILEVELLTAEPDTEIEISNVLMVSDGDDVKIGTPLVEGAKVKATVIKQGRSKKVLVFKHKRRKGYRRKNGHRQHFTQLQIVDITA